MVDEIPTTSEHVIIENPRDITIRINSQMHKKEINISHGVGYITSKIECVPDEIPYKEIPFSTSMNEFIKKLMKPINRIMEDPELPLTKPYERFSVERDNDNNYIVKGRGLKK